MRASDPPAAAWRRLAVAALAAARGGACLACALAATLAALILPASAQVLYWPAGSPPIYAIQAVRNVIAASSLLTLPSGLVFVSLPFAGPPGGLATLAFSPPSGDSFSCTSPMPTVTAGGNFSSAFVLTCSASAITVQVSFGNAVIPTAGTITLGAFSLLGSSPGLATLAALPPGNPAQLNCTYLVSGCDLSVTVISSSNAAIANQAFPGSLATILAQSTNEIRSFSTAAPVDGVGGSICIDLFSAASQGTAFQQPCQTTPSTVSLAGDVGYVDIGEAHYLGADGVTPFRWNGPATLILTAKCGGTQLQNVGSVPAGCGRLPLTGASVFLVAAGSNPASAACPADLASAQADPAAIAGTVSPPSVTFTGVPLSNPSPLYGSIDTDYEICLYGNGGGVIGDAVGWSIAGSIDCGPPAAGSCTPLAEQPNADRLLPLPYNGVATTVDYTNGGFNQIAYLRIVNRMPNIDPSTVPPGDPNVVCVNDSGITSGGSGRIVTSGAPGYNYDSGGGAPNGGREIVPGLAGDGLGLLDPTVTCQPIAQVVCQVTSDDGYNGLASLFTNGDPLYGGDLYANGPGVLAGTNVFYPIFKIFQLAGIPLYADPYNPSNRGSMVCFAPNGVWISQVVLNTDYTPVVNVR